MIRAGFLVWLLVGCETKRTAPPPPPPPPTGDAAVAVAPISVDAVVIVIEDAMPVPTRDALIVDWSRVVTAEWPSALEITEVETVKSTDTTHTHYRFRTRPPELGKAMTAQLSKFADLAKDKRTAVVSCSLSMVSRIAVVGVCSQMPEMDDSGGGAPAGPHPTYFAWWMQPGLPALTTEQLAPDIDVKALIAQTYAAAPKDCSLDHCEFTPSAFRLDDEGITLEPADYCYADCLRPKIPLADLRPTHPWGKKLVAWLRERVDAGEPVVKYVVKP